MHVCYNNDCNPNEESDEEKKSDFSAVVSRYRDKKEMDSIIGLVFTSYSEPEWPAELIVRVPRAGMLQWSKRQTPTHTTITKIIPVL